MGFTLYTLSGNSGRMSAKMTYSSPQDALQLAVHSRCLQESMHTVRKVFFSV